MTESEFMINFLLSLIVAILVVLASTLFFKKEDGEIKSLLKQICENTRDKTTPAKPVNVRPSKSEVTKWASCPACGSVVLNNKKYCDKCGQALDWSDSE